MLPTIERQPDAVVMIDQRKLPAQEVYVHCKTANEVARAITTMVIRGAPAIGVAAAMGIALGMRRSKAQGTKQFAIDFNKICEVMAATRPTAVNLFWAISRMKRAFATGVQAGESVDELRVRLDAEDAHAVYYACGWNNAARLSLNGARQMPRSVMMPATSACGVTSNDGFHTDAPSGVSCVGPRCVISFALRCSMGIAAPFAVLRSIVDSGAAT